MIQFNLIPGEAGRRRRRGVVFSVKIARPLSSMYPLSEASDLRVGLTEYSDVWP